METITSRQNPLMTHIRRLAGSAAYRRQTGQCLCDSPKLLREAAQWGAEVQTVVSVEPWPEPLPEKVRQVLVPPEVMASISPAKTPQGVLFTCRAPVLPVPETLPGRRYVVLDGVQDPGNVGTVLRTLDAFDADGLLLTGGCADPFGPKTVRASMGAVFRRPVWSVTPEELGDLLRRSGIPLYGAALRPDAMDARQADYSRCALAIGSEGRGLSREVLDLGMADGPAGAQQPQQASAAGALWLPGGRILCRRRGAGPDRGADAGTGPAAFGQEPHPGGPHPGGLRPGRYFPADHAGCCLSRPAAGHFRPAGAAVRQGVAAAV